MSDHSIRMQRYRQSPEMRRFVREVSLDVSDFISPIFVDETIDAPMPVESLPGVSRFPLSSVLDEAKQVVDLNLPAVILFGIPSEKDAQGGSACESEGVIQQAIRLIKDHYPSLIVIADLCLCEYTDHGHCGVMSQDGLDHSQTLERYGKIACSYAEAGVDIVAPSGMMDGMVKAIRHALDAQGHSMVSIMSYAVKFASHFYGPFRDAAGSGDVFSGDRKHHQMSFTQSQEALREAQLDVDEGADFLMVKPVGSYLDVVSRLSDRFDVPIAAYHVSGEYAMLKAAASQGILDEKEAFVEVFTGIKRAGASLIITYYAKEMAVIVRDLRE